MPMTDARLTTIAQIVLALVFSIGLLVFMGLLLFSTVKLDADAKIIISSLLSILGAVVMMQNSHFFKSATDTAPAAYPPTLGVGAPYIPPTPIPGVQANVQLTTASVPAGTPIAATGAGTAAS